MAKDVQESVLYQNSHKPSFWQSTMRLIATVLAMVGVFAGLRLHWVNNFGGVQVDGESMMETLVDGQKLVMEYVDTHRQAKRGDIIVVRVDGYEEVKSYNLTKPQNQKLRFVIKRLIAVEGDVVRCKEGQVEIQYAGENEFTPLKEDYTYYPTAEAKKQYGFKEDYVVGEGKIFFLGDNRTNSKDSRYNDPNGSHLKGRLYERKDIVGVVPEWAIKYQTTLEKIFF